jgi:uncharacterized protein (DUF934 family)|tara:strand:+ start:259 stop:681 length:423 start_codon:yes stop_codon:yes gene_type:complete
MVMAEPHRQRVWFDLKSDRSVSVDRDINTIDASASLAGLADLPTDSSGQLQSPVTIHFASFSDVRGFTMARHLREIVGYCHRLLASGHLIPDQANYLRWCWFTHVEIDMRNEEQWRRSLALSPPPMQRVLATPASRNATR